ncbi:membrane-bound lytic murein transglycosylase B [Marmoricola sp. URHA0025 HA25]
MSAKLKGRKSKAASLVPLALLSAAWTASIAGADSVASAAKNHSHGLPDGSAVPGQAIKAPASVPIPGAIAPAVPDGAADAVVAGASTSGIPSAALSAYQRAAQIIDAADTTCKVPWELIAAIGRVESNHGQYAGNTLNSDGVSEPGVFGPELNGKNGTQAIADTDGGQLDQDPLYDRAVGPMQFIPSTWSSVKVDADGDGQRNPQDIDDASLASAVYLCSGDDDLGTRAGQEASVFRYNHSKAYVDLVLRIMEAYSQGDYTAIPSGTYGGTIFSPSAASTIKSRHHAAQQHASTATGTTSSSTGSTGTTGGTGGSTGGTPGTPGTPGTGGATDPITQAAQGLTSTLTDATTVITQPVVNTLSTLTEATGFCSGQLSFVPDLLKSTTVSLCAPRVQGKTEADAAALIPNALCGTNGVLAWLGINSLLC